MPDALSWTEEMGNRVVPAFLLTALLVPLPKAISAPFQAAPSPFVDVPAAGTVQAAVGARRLALFRGLAAFSQQPPGRAPAPVTYEVQNGDPLFALALRYNTTVDAIVAVNGLPSAHRLRLGQRLVVPGGERTAPRALTPRAV